MINNPYIKESEIIGQKKNFIFNVEQTSNHVFPNEKYTYYIYVKNISGSDIENFRIKIKTPDAIVLLNPVDEIETGVTIEADEVKLYEMTAYCSKDELGEHIVNFFGFGDGTQVLSKTLKIKCTRTYNSDKLIHKIAIYDFTPYEDKYSMEADNYSDEVVQTFKRQGLPYKAGQQPFQLQGNLIESYDNKKIEDPHFYLENKESQSFLDQYKEAIKEENNKEHVYQYISRENFVEDSIERYEGENLQEIFEKINKNSSYFRATFLKSGTNKLLTDFTHYEPNGLIYRLGLLTSELYHLLGVIPTYSYMNDYLFKWAPHPSGKHLFMDSEHSYEEEPHLLNLYPKQRSMQWGKHLWGGQGWIVYQIPTEEYSQTEEYQRRIENGELSYKQRLKTFEEKTDAESYIKRLLDDDDSYLSERRLEYREFDYIIEQSLYDNGVFFINIPIEKIPSNFYLLNPDSLYPVIERTKPFGTKPIINYIVDKSFYLDLKQDLVPNYYSDHTFENMIMAYDFDVSQYRLIERKRTCDNQEYDILEDTLVKKYLSSKDLDFDTPISLKIDSSEKSILLTDSKGFDSEMEESIYALETEIDRDLRSLKNIIDVLYENNYNNISFYINSESNYHLPLNTEKNNIFDEMGNEYIILNESTNEMRGFDTIKLDTSSMPKEKVGLIIEDTFNKKHEFSMKYDEVNDLMYFDYNTINRVGKKTIKKQGALERVSGLVIKIFEKNNKKIILFFIQVNTQLHYFAHNIILDATSLEIIGDIKKVYYSNKTLGSKIIFNTPIFYRRTYLQPSLVLGGENWNNLYRLNNESTSYAFIRNKEIEYATPDSILLHYDNIDLPETSIVKKINLKINGTSNRNNNIYLLEQKSTNYLIQDAEGNELQVRPNKIEAYHHKNNSTTYYQINKDLAIKNNKESHIEMYDKLLLQNILYNEDADIETEDYLKNFDDYITITQQHWCEISEFNINGYALNNTESISLVLEGFNEGSETHAIGQVLSQVNNSSEVDFTIPSGYFNVKVPLLYSNDFLLELIRIRFRFKNIIKNIRLYNTALNITFKEKEKELLEVRRLNEGKCEPDLSLEISEEYIYPIDYNNGLTLQMDFDDLDTGGFYNLNETNLEIIYKETEIDFVTKGLSQDILSSTTEGGFKSVVSANSNDIVLAGEFYNDHETISQIESNVGLSNSGIELSEGLFQSFIAKEDNITAIEIYPNGFVGQPDEVLKIGIYSNHGNTPNDLIKEVYASGWVKSNPELRGRSSIKYNINVNNLEIGRTYWVKIEIDTPQENSYYRLKGVNYTIPNYKMLLYKNNNYINTFSCLTFNIYSKNIMKSFNHFSAIQEVFNNPNILIGLNKGRGEIKDLIIKKNKRTISGEDHMGESFNNDITQSLIIQQGDSYFIIINGDKFPCDEEGNLI